MKYTIGLECRISGCVSRNDGELMTEDQANDLAYDILAVVEKHGMGFGGGWGIIGADEYIDTNGEKGDDWERVNEAQVKAGCV